MNGESMLPLPYHLFERRCETHDSMTLLMRPLDEAIPRFEPGQFTMLYTRSVGEIAISISGDPSVDDGTLTQTIRDVGAVSRALHDAPLGSTIGVRGPFGVGWRLRDAIGHDVVIVAGGVGLAPLRPVVFEALTHREWFRRLTLIVGARGPEEFLYRDQFPSWQQRDDLDLRLTVDVPAPGWSGPVGFVTEPLSRLELDAPNTFAFVCGPEPMMRFSAETLLRKGVAPSNVRISLERNMKCGVGLCGHCQFGPLLVCRDGPVVDYAQVGSLLTVGEL